MKHYIKFFKAIEYVLAAGILFVVIIFAYNSILQFGTWNWGEVETMYRFISYVLMVLVGLELVRLVISHSLTTVLELIILIIARKLLSPTIDPVGLFFSVLSLLIIIVIYYIYMHKPVKGLEDLTK